MNKMTIRYYRRRIYNLNVVFIVIFFLLGLLSFPHKFQYIMGTAIVIALYILLIARPLTVLLIL